MLQLNTNWESSEIQFLDQWHPVVKKDFEDVQDAINNHTSGIADKHNTSTIENDSSVEGETVKDALENNKLSIDNHTSGISGKHSSENIIYNGSFIGKDNVKDALDQAKKEINELVVNASIDPEVALARNSAIKQKVFTTLDDRLEESEQEFINLVNNMSDYETIEGSQAKATTALNEAKSYTNNQVTNVVNDNEYQTPTIVGTQIQIVRNSNSKRLFFYLSSDLSGGNITISLDNGVTSIPLKDIKDNQLTILKKGYQEVVDNTSFFTLRPRGGGGTATESKVLKGYTFTNDDGSDKVGTYDIPDEAWFKPHATWYKLPNHETQQFYNGIGGCVCDNKLYLIGLFGGGTPAYSKIVMYDPYTNTWAEGTTPPLTPSYSQSVVGVFNHKIYYHTNQPVDSTTDRIYVYDTIGKTWSNFLVKTTVNHASSGRWIMKNEDTFYCTGGNSTKIMDMYIKSTNTVTQKTAPSVSFDNPGVLYNPNNDIIYYIGGTGSGTLYTYNCSNDTWAIKTPYNTGEISIYASIIIKDQNTLLIGKGYTNNYPTANNEFKFYDISSDTYSSHALAPLTKIGGCTGYINNKLYWFGGMTTGGSENTYVYFY
jgi:hypothetical protein